jgi:hypothetical protein
MSAVFQDFPAKITVAGIGFIGMPHVGLGELPQEIELRFQIHLDGDHHPV